MPSPHLLRPLATCLSALGALLGAGAVVFATLWVFDQSGAGGDLPELLAALGLAALAVLCFVGSRLARITVRRGETGAVGGRLG
jgi:hypothetical protein